MPSKNVYSVKIRKKGTGKVRDRPQSAFLLSSSISKSSNMISEDPTAHFGNVKADQCKTIKESVRSEENADFDSVDSDEEEVPSRRLQRSKIIASFLEQLDDNNSVIEDDFGDNDKNVAREPANNNNTSSHSNDNNNLKCVQS